MQLEVLPAGKGDCLILRHQDQGVEKLILIDGGPAGVYTQTLKPRLLALRAERAAGLPPGSDEPLFIDLVVVSHIDDDHINGIKALLNDMADRADRHEPPLFTIGRLWHNGFDSLLDADAGTVDSTPTAAVTASIGGAWADDEPDAERRDLLKIIASVGQGHDVVAMAKKLGIRINPEFNGAAIVAAGDASLTIDGLKVTVVGPLQPELDALRADFKKWLADQARGDATPAALLASFTDKSVPNLSSIVLLVEGDGERYLLTGDARGDNIMKAVVQLVLAPAGAPFPLDLLKVQHHGSDRNNTESFFRAFPAKRYVFSGNGEHGNPERETFGFLVAALGGAATEVQLTYTPEQIDKGRAAEWAKHHKHGPAFDIPSQGIVPFLAAHPNLQLQLPD